MKKLVAAILALAVAFTPALVMAQPATQAYQYVWDGSKWVPVTGTSSGVTSATQQFRTEQNLLNNATINTLTASGIIDATAMPGPKYLMVRSVGGLTPASIQVSMECSYTSAFDSLSTFTFPLGGTRSYQTINGAPPATTADKWKVVYNLPVWNGATMSPRPAQLIPLCDSTTGAWANAPYIRIIFQSTGSIAGVYAHLIGLTSN